MSKKTFYVFIALVIAVIAGLGWYFFGPKASTNEPNIPNDSGTNLFPFGQGGTGTTSGSNGQLNPDGGTSTTTVIDLSTGSDAPRLRQVWKDQTAGATFVANGSTTMSIRFVDRATGHIYESPIETIGQTKISNITIPQVHEALWAGNSKQLVMRYLKDDGSLQSFYAKLSDEAPTIEGYFLPASIRDISVLGDKILYFDPTAVTDGLLLTADMDGSKKSTVISLDTSDWLISWANAKNAMLVTKPSGTVPGFGFMLDIAKGTVEKISSNILGLNANLSPSGEVAFLSAAQGKGIASAAYSVSKKTNALVSLNTLADKCTWANTEKDVIYCAVPTSIPSATYPDDWYKGIVSFNDRIWKIDMVSGETDLMSDIEFETVDDMDIFKLSLDVSDSYIMFTNKKDMSLWSYKLQ